MTQASADIPAAVQVPPGGASLAGLPTLFWLTVRQHARGLRLLLVALLFLLPTFLVVLLRIVNPRVEPAQQELVFVLHFLPHVLVPLAALLYASGMIQDEIEEQTLTYLLIRPLPRWAIYLTKFVATFLVTAALVSFFTLVTYGAIAWGRGEFAGEVIPQRPLQMAALFTLVLLAYCSVFGLLSLFLRRSLITGVVYIAVFEGLLANLDFAFRHLTIVWYFRVLCARWLGLNPPEWKLSLVNAPTAENAVLILLGVSLAAAVLGALVFARREFRMKTPEGS